ncbi:MAG: tetratricopeptide repeat protein [Polyangiaceae bacterium]
MLSALVSREPWSFHVGNLAVHLLNVALVVSLARALRLGTWATWTSASLFALHPMQTEAVTYVSGRSAALSTTFMLLALRVRAFRSRSGHAFLREVAALTLLALAILTKETSVVLLAAFVLWDVLLEGVRGRDVGRRIAVGAGLVLVAAVFFLVHPSTFVLLDGAVGQRAFADAVAHQLAGMAYLASRWFLLARPCIDPGLWAEPSSLAVGTGALVVATCGILGFTERNRRPLVSFGVLAFLLHTFVPFVLVSRVDVINERHAYVANAGLFLAVGVLVEEWAARSRRRVVEFATIAVIGVLVVQTVRRNLEYRSVVSLWEASTREAPKNARAFHNLGVAYEREGRLEPAMRSYTRALELEPRFEAARENLARVRDAFEAR